MSHHLHTINTLADEALVTIRDEGWTIEHDPGLIRQACEETVPPITTSLFQLVVEDNGLAFLDADTDSREPFDVLFSAIAEAVTAEVWSRLDDEDDEDDDD